MHQKLGRRTIQVCALRVGYDTIGAARSRRIAQVGDDGMNLDCRRYSQTVEVNQQGMIPLELVETGRQAKSK